MYYEKTRKTKKVGVVDKRKLQWLRDTQKKRNLELKENGIFCNLHPHISTEACNGCSAFKECKHLEWEREYLLKEASKKAYNRRKRKKQNSKKDTDFFKEIEDDEIDEEESEEEFSYPDWDETCWW